jgi:L-alanine-DL-glutamate epimerase-like enolase superfamily enzyme
MSSSLRIVDIKAYPTSFAAAPENRVSFGIGQSVKRDAVVVKVTTDSGLIGWGESPHGHGTGAVAQLANTALRQLVLGMDAGDVIGVRQKIYKNQLGSHGMGAVCCIAVSGIDLALWDIRGQAATTHFLCAMDNGGYFEGDVSKGNLFRDELVSPPYELGEDGCVRPLEGNGLGLQVNERFLQKHPVIEGPGYV